MAKFQDFRMLKTVNRGSFGKVDYVYMFAVQHYALSVTLCLPPGYLIFKGPPVNCAS